MSIARGYNTVLNKGKHVKSINFFNAQFVWSIDTNYESSWRNMADFYSTSFLSLFEYRIDFSANWEDRHFHRQVFYRIPLYKVFLNPGT